MEDAVKKYCLLIIVRVFVFIQNELNLTYLWSAFRICAIEREKGTHLYGKRNDFRKDYCTMEEQEMKMVSDRKTESNQTLDLYPSLADLKLYV